MYLRTSGKPSKISIQMCKKAVRFYAEQLLGRRLASNIHLKVKFNNKELKGGYYGFCDWICDRPLPRNFVITIDPNLSKRMMLLVLAHEMVHVKQYARGELKDLLRSNKVKFLGEVYDDELMSYWSHPWEKEARLLEKELYHSFRQTITEK